jgi:hypothetical protein
VGLLHKKTHTTQACNLLNVVMVEFKLHDVTGPGSLPPGLMSKRRPFDDASSDISSASSMMEYTGNSPRHNFTKRARAQRFC